MAYAPSRKELDAYGLYALPGMGLAYPALKEQIQGIVSERVATLSWIPPDFANKYMYFSLAQPDAIITLSPALGTAGFRNASTPAWIDNQQKENTWTQIAKQMDMARYTYAQGERDKARDELARLNADSAFWNTVAEGVGGVGKTIGAGAAGVKSAFFWITIAAVGAGVFYWYYQDPEGFKRFFKSFAIKRK